MKNFATSNGERNGNPYQHQAENHVGLTERVRFQDHNVYQREVYALGVKVAGFTGWRRRLCQWVGVF